MSTSTRASSALLKAARQSTRTITSTPQEITRATRNAIVVPPPLRRGVRAYSDVGGVGVGGRGEGEGRSRTFSAGQMSRMAPGKRSKYLILKEVPRTALPSDVLNALRDVGAVDASFPVSAITSPPPSLPRSPSLTKPYHLSLTSHAEALRVHTLLSSRPLFALSLPSEMHFSPAWQRQGGLAAFTEASPVEWVGEIIDNFTGGAASSSSASASEEGAGRSRRRDGRDARDGREGRQADEGFTAEWVVKACTSGRRVVIRGLPGSLGADQVRRLAGDCGVVGGSDGVKRLPPSHYTLVSTFCITTNSVAEAYRLVRKVHMKWYKSSVFGEKYLMRAEVVY